MDIEKIQAAISAMPSTRVQGGKTYSMVAQRVEAFRKNVGAEMGIDTELLVDDGKRVLIKARIKTPDGFTVAAGYTEEIRGSSNINRGAAIENCETSAVGRALAALGLHGGEYASVNEIEKHSRNMDAAHDQAVREEREELPVNPPSASSPGGSDFGMTVNAPADDIPWPEDPAKRWQDWMMRIKNQVSKMTATWQIKKLGEKENDNLKSLRQFKNEWANELIAYIDVRWDQLNNGER